MEEIIKLLGCREFVCLDVETTSFTSAYGELIEIGAVKIKDGIVIDTFNQLIKPRKVKKLPKKIVEVTNITDDMLVDKPYMEEVLPKFKEFIGNRIIVGHNVSFDWDKMLKVFFKSIGIVATNQTIDTLALAKETLKERKKGFKLGQLCEYLNIPLDNAHRALEDATATSKLFLTLKNINQNNLLSDIEEYPYEEEVKPVSDIKCSIKKVSYWVKEKPKAKTKEHERLYINLFYNNKFTSVYLDLLTSFWYINPKNDIEETLDFNIIENQCIKFLKLNSKEELMNYKN